MSRNTGSALVAIAKSRPGKVTARTIFRGYDIEVVDGAHIILRNGQVVSTQPSEQAALAFINPLADEATREARRQREADEAARQRETAAPSPARQLATFEMMGFKRDTKGVNVRMFVDANPRAVLAGEGGPQEVADAIHPGYFFPASSTVSKPVPDAAKNKLFFSEEELYAAAPEHRPPGRRKKTPLNRAASQPRVTEPARPAASPPAIAAKRRTYQVQGFKRDDLNVLVTMIVDNDNSAGTPTGKVAEAIAGPDFCFTVSMNIDHAVPAAAKNVLFFSDEELFAAVPEMRPAQSTRRKKTPFPLASQPPAVTDPAPSKSSSSLLTAMTAALAAPTPPKSPQSKAALTPPDLIVPSKKAPIASPAQQELPLHITTVEYGSLEYAFDYFNKALFDGTLLDVMIIYGRRAHSRGHYGPDRWSGRTSKFRKPELSLNPDCFIDRTDEQIVSTLVHEMVHHWQYMFGSPGSRGYHNRQWGQKMIEIGLMPSNTGAVGGKMTGTQMTHYILPDGPFTRAFAVLAAEGWRLNLQSAITVGASKAPASKVKFTCPSCNQNAWGKPDLEINCRPCECAMSDAAA